MSEYELGIKKIGAELGYRRKNCVYVRAKCNCCGRLCWKLERSVDIHTFISLTPCNACITDAYSGTVSEPPPTSFTYVDSRGYVMRVLGLSDPFFHAVKTGRILEHRYVMSIKLGRLLTKAENVHHIDGNRQNNSDSNLELWITSQCFGQRADDLITEYLSKFPEKVEVLLKRVQARVGNVEVDRKLLEGPELTPSKVEIPTRPTEEQDTAKRTMP